MHIAPAQPEHLAPAQPRPGHQQHDQPVPRRTARPQHRDDIGVSGPVHRRLRLVQPVPGPHPPGHPAVLSTRRPGKVTIISDLIEQRHQMPGRGPSATACTTMPRTAASTALIRRADRAEAPLAPPAPRAGRASMPDTAGPACASQVMNSPSCPTPACQVRPDRAHQRRNNAIEPA